MSLTLADVQVTMTDDIDFNNIDEARKSSFVLDRMSFENTVSPDTNGGTLTTGYTRTITERAADTRQENTEYPAREARKQKYTVDLIPLGARYNVDRVYAGLGDATTNQVVFQQAEARKATIAKFHDLFINGVAADFAQAVPEFDGLDKIVTGTTTESFATGTTPWDFDTITDKAGAMAAKRALTSWLRSFYRKPDVIFANEDGIAWLEQIADWIGFYTETKNAWGESIDNFRGIPFIDLGEKDGSSDPIITTSGTGTTSLYGVCFGTDSVHGYSVNGSQILKQWLPDFSVAGAVKPGEVELGPVAIAAKRTKGVGAFRVDVQ